MANKSPAEIIGEKIKKFRMDLGDTQEAFAAKLDIGRPTLSLIEQGKQEPDIRVLINIIKVTKIDIMELLELSYKTHLVLDTNIILNCPYILNSLTTFCDFVYVPATVIKEFYQTIATAAGDTLLLGCNTVSHLAAGILHVQRTGHDTSGRSFEITRISGPASMLRLPQNNIFYASDPDCAAFTSRVPIGANLDYLEECAITGMVTLASVTPGILKGEDLARIRGIYKIASEGGSDAVPTDWLMHNNPSHFIDRYNKHYDYDWYKVYDGVRSHYTWMN
jgi:transcriptional regulator with XRE-family HTH domain